MIISDKIKSKIQFSLFLYLKKACVGVVIQLPSLMTSALDVGKRLASHPATFSSRTH
jgi:hypothetical protein